MKELHKKASIWLFILTSVAAYVFNIAVSDGTIYGLLALFVTGFIVLIVSIALLYSSEYSVQLYEHIDDKVQRRGTYILKSYLYANSNCLIVLVCSVILFTTSFTSMLGSFVVLGCEIYLASVFSSVLLGMAALSVFNLILLVTTVISGMLNEVKIKASKVPFNLKGDE